MEEFGRYLKHLREQAGYSQRGVDHEVMNRWGISISKDNLALWEGGKTPGIPAVPLACLARLYGVGFEELFGQLFRARFGDRADAQDDPDQARPAPTVDEATPPAPGRRRARGKQSGTAPTRRDQP